MEYYDKAVKWFICINPMEPSISRYQILVIWWIWLDYIKCKYTCFDFKNKSAMYNFAKVWTFPFVFLILPWMDTMFVSEKYLGTYNKTLIDIFIRLEFDYTNMVNGKPTYLLVCILTYSVLLMNFLFKRPIQRKMFKSEWYFFFSVLCNSCFFYVYSVYEAVWVLQRFFF